jgi:spore coat polysaccharide biosynthesis predicted glycosyltransferase SpsG
MNEATGRTERVIFRVAAGPRCGFGHLVRCRSLSHALGVDPRVSVRGTAATRAVAASFGWTVIDVDSDRGLRAEKPALLVVDDPSAAATREWVRRARRLNIPVATIHDLGRDYAASDLIVDGSISSRSNSGQTAALGGPQFAILHPAFATMGQAQPNPRRVLIALGGGGHVLKLARHLCDEIARRAPVADIHVARGFVPGRRDPVLPAGRWVSAPDGLATELSQAAVAVVAGGVTLYEACALGIPVVALAVTSAQHKTIRDMAHRGAVIDAGSPSAIDMAIELAADLVSRLLDDERLGRRYSKTARTLVDGRGAIRVAERLRRLMDDAATKRGTRAA